VLEGDVNLPTNQPADFSYACYSKFVEDVSQSIKYPSLLSNWGLQIEQWSKNVEQKLTNAVSVHAR